MKQYDYLIVGAGLYGAVFAQQAVKKDKKVLVIDKRPNKCIHRRYREDPCTQIRSTYLPYE